MNKDERALSFINIAYKDYLAARVLFNQRLLYRAAILANTCIEKYFKSLIFLQGRTSIRTHDVEELFKEIRGLYPELHQNINNEFIQLINKAYHTRYFDDKIFIDENEEFDICILQNKTLAELDYTVNLIQGGLSLSNNKKFMYELDRENQHPILVNNNFIFSGMTKTQFIERIEFIYGLRNTAAMGILEIVYETEDAKNDGNFLITALQPVKNSD